MSSSTFKKEMLDADSDDSKSESPPRPENDDKKTGEPVLELGIIQQRLGTIHRHREGTRS
jgi:hypothetical protein